MFLFRRITLAQPAALIFNPIPQSIPGFLLHKEFCHWIIDTPRLATGGYRVLPLTITRISVLQDTPLGYL